MAHGVAFSAFISSSLIHGPFPQTHRRQLTGAVRGEPLLAFAVALVVVAGARTAAAIECGAEPVAVVCLDQLVDRRAAVGVRRVASGGDAAVATLRAGHLAARRGLRAGGAAGVVVPRVRLTGGLAGATRLAAGGVAALARGGACGLARVGLVPDTGRRCRTAAACPRGRRRTCSSPRRRRATASSRSSRRGRRRRSDLATSSPLAASRPVPVPVAGAGAGAGGGESWDGSTSPNVSRLGPGPASAISTITASAPASRSRAEGAGEWHAPRTSAAVHHVVRIMRSRERTGSPGTSCSVYQRPRPPCRSTPSRRRRRRCSSAP